MSATPNGATELDPLFVLKGLASLRRLTGSYPSGHPTITQKLHELDEAIKRYLAGSRELRIDMIHGNVFLDGVLFEANANAAPTVREITDLGVDSIYIREGIDPQELLAVAECLWGSEGDAGVPLDARLARRNVQSVSLGRLVSLDTRWRAHQWPDAPTGPLDPAYAESLLMAQQTFDDVAEGKGLDPVTVGDLVQLLLYRVARSHAALGQILAVKQYENLTYCHSVNVAMLSLLIGKQIGLDEGALASLVEAAVLHDIGKTRIPLDIVKKPGALDKRERRMIEAHTTLGAEILVQTDGIGPLAPTVALEHHRGVRGTGYPDIGNAIPHVMSQIVTVADIYEAMTGARSYQAPAMPEQACLVLARLAGDKLNTALVKAFVNAITFFPIGSVVRTSEGEVGVVVASTPGEPLHPVVSLVDTAFAPLVDRIDTAERAPGGDYRRHIVETLAPPDGFDVRQFLAA